MFSYSAPMPLLRKVNVEGTKNLLDQCINSNVKKMVMWSSIAAYGKADPKFYPMPIPELAIDKFNPKTGGHYDLSKREQEAAAQKYWDENKFPITFMRCAPLYGPGSYYGIYILLKYIKYEVLPLVPGNLHNVSVPLVHAEDVARAAVHLSDPDNFNGEAYNVVDDNLLDMVDTFKFIAQLTDSKFTVMMPIWIPLLYPIFQVLGWWSMVEAKHLRKKINGKIPMPKLETDTLLYLFGNFFFDNKKLKDTGFGFKYADRRIGLLENIEWYDKNGWERPLTIKGV
jgi:nucleoside-diphosphate-sugar epimerase